MDLIETSLNTVVLLVKECTFESCKLSSAFSLERSESRRGGRTAIGVAREERTRSSIEHSTRPRVSISSASARSRGEPSASSLKCSYRPRANDRARATSASSSRALSYDCTCTIKCEYRCTWRIRKVIGFDKIFVLSTISSS